MNHDKGWMSGDEPRACTKWSRVENKIFELGLAFYPEDSEDRWEKIAANIPGKSVEDIKQHYEILLDDVNRIESGRVPLPCYGTIPTGREGGEGSGTNNEILLNDVNRIESSRVPLPRYDTIPTGQAGDETLFDVSRFESGQVSFPCYDTFFSGQAGNEGTSMNYTIDDVNQIESGQVSFPCYDTFFSGQAGNEGTSMNYTIDDVNQIESGQVSFPCYDTFFSGQAGIEGTSMNYTIDDVSRFESGQVPLPCYDTFPTGQEGSEGTGKKGSNLGQAGDKGTGMKASSLGQAGDEGTGIKGSSVGQSRPVVGNASRAEQERRKGVPWSKEEQKLFLLGLEKYGKGDWRSISRNFVKTRTPTQVASHAQKYYVRLNSQKKNKRDSIHDMTINDHNNEVSVHPGPIPGQADDLNDKRSKQPSPSSEALSGVGSYGGTEAPLGVGSYGGTEAPLGVGSYGGSEAPLGVGLPVGTTNGQPVGGHLISTIGTSANFPQQALMANLPQQALMANLPEPALMENLLEPAHVAQYGVSPPIHEQMFRSPPLDMGPMAYSVASSYSGKRNHNI